MLVATIDRPLGCPQLINQQMNLLFLLATTEFVVSLHSALLIWAMDHSPSWYLQFTAADKFLRARQMNSCTLTSL